MKKLPLLILVSSLAATLAARAQTVVFSDNFSSSTLNPTATSPGTISSTRTAYEIGSSKSGTGTTISGASGLTLATGATSSGFTEAQALFTTTPITLSGAGQYVLIYYTFVDTVNVNNNSAGNGSGPYIGIFNSGGAAPTNGTALWSSGLTQNVFTATNGAAAGWAGYVGNFAYSSNSASSSAISSRPPQAQLTNSCQELLFSSTYLNKTNQSVLSGIVGQPALTAGNVYTLALQVTYTNAACVGVNETLYNGAGTGGAIVSSGGYTATMNGAATNTTSGTSSGPIFKFDGLAVGYRPGATAATTFQITNITVINYVPAAPTISNLTNLTVIAGNNTTLAPTITGAPAPSYQWQTNGVSISGATSSTLALNNVQYSQNGYIYSLIASNFLGIVTNSMTLSVIVTPAISGLNDQSANVGDNVTISPTASGVPTPTYQWQFGGVNLTDGLDANGSTISGSSTASLSIANAQSADSGIYSLVASNSAGIVTNSMQLTVSSGNLAPVLTGPTNITVIQGNNGTFSASAIGVPVPTLQWYDQTGAAISGATGNTLVLNNVQYSQNGYVYSLVASNSAGMTTNSAMLTVIVSPVITLQPTSLTVTNTQSASFTVAASGVPNPTYQWYQNGSPISSAVNSSATNATLAIASAAPTNSGNTFYVAISNGAGSTNSATVTLAVNSAMSATAFSPANGATGLCYDTPLTATFNSTISLGASGFIKIYNVTNSTTPVDTINVALGAVQQRTFPSDGQSFSYQTIQISGSSVKIYPHFNVLSSNATYYVTIDNGAFTDTAGANFVGITATNAWQFSTKAGGPVDPANPIVNADGSGDFLTVQGAVNSIPTGTNASQRVINIRNGIYNEIVDITGRHNVTFRGQSRAGTVIAFPNNAALQVVNSGTTHARMTFKVNANDIALDTLTISNSTPQGGTQAEALMAESNAKRCIVNNCEIDSRQDTILANVNSSQVYFYKSIIKGNFDYIWGGGNLYFDQCAIQTIAGASGFNLTAARTDTSASTSTNFPWANPGGTFTANGMSFVNCTFGADSGVGTVTLAGSNGTAGNNVSWYGCDFATNYIAPSAALFSGNYVFWQDVNTSNGTPVTYPVVISISGTDARLLAATNIPTWFYGWTPSLAPTILTNPISQTVVSGLSATFTVVATGIPNPTYQWQHAGTNLSVASSATLTIPSATSDDAGSYAVIVTTTGGTATSASATLTVNPPSNTAPTFTAPISGTNFNINVGVNLSVACTATDSDTPAQTLTYSLLAGPGGSAVDSSSGNFTWRPSVAQTNSMNAVQVVVTDNGTPAMSATNNFTVTVNSLSAPTTSVLNYSSGQFSVSLNGQIGPDYELQGTTNLSGGTWTSIATTNSPATMPVILADPNAGAQPMMFYRIVTGPPLP